MTEENMEEEESAPNCEVNREANSESKVEDYAIEEINCEPEIAGNFEKELVENSVHETVDDIETEKMQNCEPELAQNCESEKVLNYESELAANRESKQVGNCEPEEAIYCEPDLARNYEPENAVISKENKAGNSYMVNEQLIEPEHIFIKEETNESDDDIPNTQITDNITENGQRTIYHIEKDNFPCDLCEESFTKSGFLKRHKLMHHNDSEEPYEKNVQCEICEKWLTSKKSLKVHQSVIHLGNFF